MSFVDVPTQGYKVIEFPYNLPPEFRGTFPNQDTFRKFPHVFEKVNGLWGSNECHDYLHSIVVNGFDRNRSGFPHEVITELLWLGNMHPYVPPVKDVWGRNPHVR
jgi:hypothetical protein